MEITMILTDANLCMIYEDFPLYIRLIDIAHKMVDPLEARWLVDRSKSFGISSFI